MKPVPKSAYVGIFLLAGSIILFQIALTRVFAIVMWHHFTYMVISIAMLGFGAAGSLLTARREGLKSDDPSAAITRWSAAYGLTVILSFFWITRININTLEIWSDKSNAVALLLFYLIIAIPMIFGGLAIGAVLTRMARKADRLYFADLIGSALGGAASVVLLQHFGSTTTVIFAGAIGALAAFVFSFSAPFRSKFGSLLVLLGCLALSIGFLGGSTTLKIPAMDWDVPYAPGKDIHDLGVNQVESRIPSSTAEVLVSKPQPAMAPMIGGNCPLGARPYRARLVAQDGTAPTMLYEGAAQIENFPFLKQTQAATAYVAYGATGRTQPDVLVIGVGGGADVMVALAHDAKKVTAAEINTAMIRMVTEDYADYIGGLFTPDAHPLANRIELLNREGRSQARHGDTLYDVINMAGVDSFTALSTGAYTLSESYLYTVEAVKDFYAKLKDGGYIHYSRFIQLPPRKPRETLRLTNIARTALSEVGVEDPGAQIVVFAGMDWASTLIKKGPFLPEELETLQNFARDHGYVGFVYDPSLRGKDEAFNPTGQGENLLGRVVTEVGPEYFNKALNLELDLKSLSPTVVQAFRKTMHGQATEADTLIKTWMDQNLSEDTSNTARTQLLSRIKGILKESIDGEKKQNKELLATRLNFRTLLGNDEAARTGFMDSYPYVLSACRDDAPFFFNYHRPDWSLDDTSDGELSSFAKRYHTDVPVGHRVLYLSLLQIGIVAFILIFLPLRSLKSHGVSVRGAPRYLFYFASLGLGFMFIEIALMQKFAILLGHPTYAISVVLTSLLAFAGFGSLLSGRIRQLSRGRFFLIFLGIAASLGLIVLASEFLFPILLGQALMLRIATAVILIAPLALCLGMPFPLGIRITEQTCPQLIPWGWAVNGFLSVLGSILAIVLSQQVGFTLVLACATGIYFVGLMVMNAPKSQAEAEAGAGAPAVEPS